MNFLYEIRKAVKDCLTDQKTGRYSHAKVISTIGALCASAMLWKLILLGGANEVYFGLYLAFCSGHQVFNKYLDNKTLGTVLAADNTGKEKAE